MIPIPILAFKASTSREQGIIFLSLNKVLWFLSSVSKAHKGFIRVLTDRLEQNQAFWICLNDFKGGAEGYDSLIYCFPPLSSDWCFAFPCLPAFMASSCVQRCGSSNKEPFNFAHISIKRKNKRDEELLWKRMEIHYILTRVHRACAIWMRNFVIPALSITQYNIKKKGHWTLILYYWQYIYNSPWGFQRGTANHMLWCAAVLRLMQQENPLNHGVLMS